MSALSPNARTGLAATAARVCEVKIRVRYAETDQMGIVYHANHFIWFEVGRVEFLRELGFSYRDMEQKESCCIAVVDARCRYKAPAFYDDEILVRTYLKHLRETLLQFGYQLMRVSDGVLLAEGETTHVVTDPQMRKRVLPEKYMKVFREAVATNGERRSNNG
jgi:acyl-CoA thioester hydrolase